MSLFQFSRLVKLSSPFAVPTSCVITFQLTPSYHAFHAITSSLSCHPRSHRVWIPLAWLFCVVRHPAVTLSAPPPLVQSLWFVSGISLCRPRCSSRVDMLLRQAPPPVRPLFFLAPKHTLRAIPARHNSDEIYASHRSKHVLPSFFALLVHITFPVLYL